MLNSNVSVVSVDVGGMKEKTFQKKGYICGARGEGKNIMVIQAQHKNVDGWLGGAELRNELIQFCTTTSTI